MTDPADLVSRLRDRAQTMDEYDINAVLLNIAASLIESLQRQLADARTRIKWFEDAGGVTMTTRVFHEISRAESAERRVVELEARLKALCESEPIAYARNNGEAYTSSYINAESWRECGHTVTPLIPRPEAK